MRIERVVVNASPLITLFRAGLHPLLPRLFTEIVVPEAVWAEVVSQTHNDPAARGLPASNWARRTPTPICPDVALWNLGAGETAVLSFLSLAIMPNIPPSSMIALPAGARVFWGFPFRDRRGLWCLPDDAV